MHLSKRTSGNRKTEKIPPKTFKAFKRPLISEDERLNLKLADASKKGEFGEVKKLLEKGADVDFQDKSGWTALMYAVFEYEEIAELLVLNKANINLKNEDGRTALMFACWQGHLNTAKFLIENGAEVNVQDIYEKSILEGVIECRKFYTDLKYKQIENLLKENGAK
ncbi:ankyrin repeat domain-containing protein [Candidatus Micrarchaeota archaeon]|nr:ankyrin repeat domain-containing protein [Candidatus Micrarchaeota archaeon]